MSLKVAIKELSHKMDLDVMTCMVRSWRKYGTRVVSIELKLFLPVNASTICLIMLVAHAI